MSITTLNGSSNCPGLPDLQMREIANSTGAQSTIGFVVQIENGEARAILDMHEGHINRNGGLHGGIAATLLDSVCGYTASIRDGDDVLHPVTTVSLTVNYLAHARVGRVVATAKLTGGGKHIVFTDAVLTADDGTTLATATGTYKMLSRPRSQTSD